MSAKETVEDWKEFAEPLVRSSLGNTGAIGQLYNARTEKLCSKSLFIDDSFPRKFVETCNINKHKVKYSYKNKLSHRFRFLNVEPDLQLDVLLGLLPLKGHWISLKHENTSASTSFLYRLSTVKEKLTNFSEIKQFMDKTVFDDEQFTHFVVEIEYGANFIIDLEYDIGEKDKTVLKSRIQNLGASFYSENDGCYTDFDEGKKHCYADVNHPKGSVTKSAKELRELVINFYDGKGIPLKYVMIPVSIFRNNEINMVTEIKSIDENFIIQLVDFLENLKTIKNILNDLQCRYSQYQHYLPSNGFIEIKRKQESVERNEAKLKKNLEKNLPRVRAGKISMTDFIRKIERRKSSKLNLVRIEDFIDKFIWIKSKTDLINLCVSKKVIYLGKDEILDYLMESHPSDDFYVMYTSEELEQKNKKLYRETLKSFLSAAESRKENEHYIMINLDFNIKSVAHDDNVSIIRFKSGGVISNDQGTKNAANIARRVSSNSFQSNAEKPFKRKVLELACPGSHLGTCPNDPLIWICDKCRDYLEYGFDNFFYCGCGKATIQLYEFKCSGTHHGLKYLSAENYYSFIKEELKKLKPPKEMNILILGQSGVGKSTWINSIVNYLQYDNLHNAEKGEVISVIPANFTLTYMKNDRVYKQIVEIGVSERNEVTEAGKSGTQDPKTYNFILGERAVRLIDTPGLGDTAGIDRDKENMQKILDHIGYLDEIHGICILLKANETKIDVLFRFCIAELLSHLHHSAARNILFCFTKSRSSFYSPGDTVIILNKLLKQLKLDDIIKLNGKTMFCLDNEAFRFLCTLRYPEIPKTEKDRKLYEGSWTKSVTETNRLFEQIKSLEPHIVTDTTNFFKAKNKIDYLTKAMAAMTWEIQINLAASADSLRMKSKILADFDLSSLWEKCSKLYLKREPLAVPQTVCQNPKCVKYHQLKNIPAQWIQFKQICHNPCFDVAKYNVISQPGLRKCPVMASGSCKVCGCGWEDHICLTYKETLAETTLVDDSAIKEFDEKKKSCDELEEYKRKIKEKQRKFQVEQEILIVISLKFRILMQGNTLAPYNDGFKSHLNRLIQLEKDKVSRSKVEEDLLKNLNETLKIYEEKVRKLNGPVANWDKSNLKVIADLEHKLYNLEIAGEQIKKAMEVYVVSDANAQKYAEQALPVKNRRIPVFEKNNCVK